MVVHAQTLGPAEANVDPGSVTIEAQADHVRTAIDGGLPSTYGVSR
jgi:hypothetical protein